MSRAVRPILECRRAGRNGQVGDGEVELALHLKEANPDGAMVQREQHG